MIAKTKTAMAKLQSPLDIPTSTFAGDSTLVTPDGSPFAPVAMLVGRPVELPRDEAIVGVGTEET